MLKKGLAIYTLDSIQRENFRCGKALGLNTHVTQNLNNDF